MFLPNSPPFFFLLLNISRALGFQQTCSCRGETWAHTIENTCHVLIYVRYKGLVLHIAGGAVRTESRQSRGSRQSRVGWDASDVLVDIVESTYKPAGAFPVCVASRVSADGQKIDPHREKQGTVVMGEDAVCNQEPGSNSAPSFPTTCVASGK